VIERIVIVGAGAAGLTAAETLRREGFARQITLIGAEHHLPYDRPPLSKQVLTGAWAPERTQLRKQKALEQLGLDLRLGVRAAALDLADQSVRLEDGQELPYDALLIATGVEPRRLRMSHELQGVHVLRTLDDALALREELKDAARLVVIGSGFLGCEVAASARSLGLEVTLVDPLAVPMLRQLGESVGRLIAQLHKDHGVDLRTGIGVERLRGERHVEALELSDGTSVAADVALIAIGTQHNTDWLKDSGLDLTDGILTDSCCQAVPGVYAAGDVARWRCPRFGGRPLRTEHRMNATEQAICAARNMLGAGEAYDPIPFYWTDQYEARIQAFGLLPQGSEVVIVEGGPQERRFIARYIHAGQIAGVLGWNMPRELRTERALIGQEAKELTLEGKA
jgi:3-phenylpropionate/trans-cinnamate dioxygenase ferredoxin reductase component